jgi:hypothetical protein
MPFFLLHELTRPEQLRRKTKVEWRLYECISNFAHA